MNDESLEQLESKIAYLERSMAELSDVVFRQQKEIQLLEIQFKALRERLGTLSAETAPTFEQERPPHY